MEFDDLKTIRKAIPKGRRRKKERLPLARAGFYIYMGKQKGLKVERGIGLDWCITLPNGTVYKTDCDSDMIDYVKRY